MFDICTVNNYLIWKEDITDTKKRGQRPFRKALIDVLLKMSYPIETLVSVKQHYKSKPMSLFNQATQGHSW